VAVEGSTITLMIPANFPTGFGRVFAEDPNLSYGAASAPEDPQRGELLFLLNDAAGTTLTILEPRYITRVFPHMGSPASISEHSFSGQLLDGQTMAVLDIPPDIVTEDGNYFIKIVRVRRQPGDQGNYFQSVAVAQTSLGEDWYGWGDDSSSFDTSPDPIPIRILNCDSPADCAPTPKHGWADVVDSGIGFSGDLSEELDMLVPHPEFVVKVDPVWDQGPIPAAWEVDVTYPRRFVRIVAVTTRTTTPGSAIVSWNADQTTGVDCTAPDDTLRIQVVDPEQTTPEVRVSFSLVNFDQSCGSRAVPADFNPVNFRAYKLDGTEATSWWTVGIPTTASFL